MGRIDPIKDLRTLINAFALVHESMPEAILRIFGSTPAESVAYRDGCVQLAEELGLTDCVLFMGKVDAPVNAYHASSIVVLSSISEGFPYTVVEAMACARTVVCTDVGGVKEAVGNAGFIVPPRNPEAMATAILRLLDDEPLRLRLAARARQRILENFTLEHSLASYQRVYEDLLRPVATGPGELVLPSYELVRWDVAVPDSDSELQETTS
jgi:glycosyltransferase involved in cell wall biosynthesis